MNRLNPSCYKSRYGGKLIIIIIIIRISLKHRPLSLIDARGKKKTSIDGIAEALRRAVSEIEFYFAVFFVYDRKFFSSTELVKTLKKSVCRNKLAAEKILGSTQKRILAFCGVLGGFGGFVWVKLADFIPSHESTSPHEPVGCDNFEIPQIVSELWPLTILKL